MREKIMSLKTIFKIFKTDLEQLYKNPLALVIVIGIIFLAGVYAWLNIDSNWDPYSNTGKMPIAVANEDSGTNFLGQEINIGEDLTEKLASNSDMKWVFVDKDSAISGTESGEYYGAIIIPRDFTGQLTTILNKTTIQKPTFDFYVNQKKNPIAPILVNKVVSTIETEIDQSFVNKVIYEVVDKAENLQLGNNTTTSDVVESLEESQKNIEQLQNLLSVASAAADSSSDALRSVQGLLSTVNSSIDNTAKISDYSNAISDLSDICTSLNTSLNEYIDKANETTNSLENLMSNLDPESATYKTMSDLVSQLKTNVSSLKTNYVDKLEDLSNTTIKNLQVLSGNISLVTTSLQNTISQSNSSLDNIINALGETSSFVDSTNEYLDDIIGDIDEVIDLVNRATESEIYLGVMNLLQNSPEVVADFISNPIEANEIDLYPTSSYGVRMAPFYTALAAWVGCTISITVLKTDVEYKNKFRKLKPYQKFWGRFLIFAIVAILQGIVISVGDLVLGVETQNNFLFICTTALISLIFVTIVYPLVVAFGKLGAGIAVVFLVFQVAGSGGTFPVELLSSFFQNIQPFMPFAPALNMLREVIGGFYGDTYLINLGFLLCHTILPLLLGLVFRKPIIETKEKYTKKLGESHLMGR